MSIAIGVIGTGTWGTTMAVVAARRGHRVTLWGRRADKAAELERSRQHPELVGHRLPDGINCTADPAQLQTCDVILWAVPTQHSAAIGEQLRAHVPAAAPVISLSKGLERETLHRPSEILTTILSNRQVGVLSGPSHAEEVIAGLPVGLVCAGPAGLAGRMQELLHGDGLRIYSSADIIGIELGGALKNVVAIAAGICQGMESGDNMLAMLVTRGLAEIRRLGRALGAEDNTFAGLAGIGDLLTTCYSPHGRNRRLGLAVGRGEDTDRLLNGNTVAEGAWTASAAVELARRHDVELPLAQEVDRVLWHGARVDTALERLLNRSAKEEDS